MLGWQLLIGMKSCATADGYKFSWQPGLHYRASAAKTAVIREGERRENMLSRHRHLPFPTSVRKHEHINTHIHIRLTLLLHHINCSNNCWTSDGFICFWRPLLKNQFCLIVTSCLYWSWINETHLSLNKCHSLRFQNTFTHEKTLPENAIYLLQFFISKYVLREA